jgi:hypothetical protein
MLHIIPNFLFQVVILLYTLVLQHTLRTVSKWTVSSVM